MSKILRNWNRLAIHDRIVFMRNAVDKQKATPSPIPHAYADLTVLDGKVTAAEGVDAEIAEHEAALEVLRPRRQQFTDEAAAEFEHDANHVEGDSKGEADLEIACGFDVAGGANPAPALTAPQDVTLTMSSAEGGIDWHCHPGGPGAIGVEAQTTLTPNDAQSWHSHPVVAQSSGTLTGLESGKRYYCRFRFAGRKGPGPWSDPQSKMAS